jgi:hypothetical protein
MSAARFISGTDDAAGVRWPSLETALAEIESARRMSQREIRKRWKGISIVEQVSRRPMGDGRKSAPRRGSA